MAELRRVFLPALLEKLAALITEQGEEALKHSDIGLHPRTTPTFLQIAKYGPMSAADIAKALNQPHQLVTQRIDLLLEIGVIARADDRADARRKLLKLTPKGKVQLELLIVRLGQAEQIYAQLFDEIGCDLAAAVTDAITALERKPLIERGRAEMAKKKPR
ncbi:MAG TPA: MarR family transcriptional regulator [Hyphomonadaceae bacterium]|jgi:DNA-binding MarR family transcriptional regulator|nr:MarR family transcriptional regulator [Hyphomonadaceae bacterium]